MPRSRLLTPGPTPVPELALQAMSRQVRHHRTAEFRGLLAEALDGLRYVFQTSNEVVIFASSGTGAMEAAMVNLVPPGGKALVLESGKFSERWRKLAEAFGIEVVRYEVPWGEPFDPARVAALLEEHRDTVAVFTTLLETSTGVVHDIEAIGRVVGPTPALLVVDGISGVGADRCLTDAWQIDVLAVGSQKALMTPPGLSFLAISPAAWRQIESFRPAAFYFDLRAYRRSLGAAGAAASGAAKALPDTPFTPAIPLIRALAESLRQMRAVGIEEIWRRTATLAAAARAGLHALGLRLVAQRPADGMTAAYVPEVVDGKEFLRELETRFGVKCAGGQGPLTGRIFRLAHMGEIDALDVISALAAVELVLAERAASVKLGTGVGAALDVLARSRSGGAL